MTENGCDGGWDGPDGRVVALLERGQECGRLSVFEVERVAEELGSPRSCSRRSR